MSIVVFISGQIIATYPRRLVTPNGGEKESGNPSEMPLIEV